MCPSSHSSLSRTSMMTALPLFDFAAASCGEISVMCFFASATSFSKPDGILGKMGRASQKSSEASVQRAAPRRSCPTNYLRQPTTDLFVTQGFDGIECGGLARWVEAEENSDRRAEQECNCDRTD